jgi:peptidyl-tRNA hydrolase
MSGKQSKTKKPLEVEPLPPIEVEKVEEKENPVIYVFLNKSLQMTAGKASAQAAHAAVFSIIESDESKQQLWRINPHKTIIVLEARDEAHIRNITTYLSQRGIYTNMVVDEGVNEIDPHTVTALSTNILDKNNEHISQSMSTFSLYRDTVKINLQFEK